MIVDGCQASLENELLLGHWEVMDLSPSHPPEVVSPDLGLGDHKPQPMATLARRTHLLIKESEVSEKDTLQKKLDKYCNE